MSLAWPSGDHHISSGSSEGGLVTRFPGFSQLDTECVGVGVAAWVQHKSAVPARYCMSPGPGSAHSYSQVCAQDFRLGVYTDGTAVHHHTWCKCSFLHEKLRPHHFLASKDLRETCA